MPTWTPPLTPNQQKAIAIIPKITASLSLIGSSFITHHVIRSRKRRQRVYHRILLGISLMDIISSFKSFLSTWPVPEGEQWGAVGTTQTCTAAGFFGHGSSLASALYNGSLTLFYFLTIRHGWREDGFACLEPWMHIVPLVIGWGTAIAGLPLILYNNIGWTCWIAPKPFGCKQTHQYGYTTCERGDNAYVYRWSFFHAELWFTFILITIGLCMIWCAVRRREKATEHYRLAGRQESQSKQVAKQAMLYVFAYYLTWIFPIITWTSQLIAEKTYTPILFLQSFFVPLQGFWNVFIYFRPRYLNYRRQHPDLTFCQVARAAIRGDSSFWSGSSSAPSPETRRGSGMLRRRDSDFDYNISGRSGSRRSSISTDGLPDQPMPQISPDDNDAGEGDEAIVVGDEAGVVETTHDEANIESQSSEAKQEYVE